jgi:hypothetical protein
MTRPTATELFPYLFSLPSVSIGEIHQFVLSRHFVIVTSLIVKNR